MKRFISFFTLFVVFIVEICAQATDINTINIKLFNGTDISYPITNIESVMHSADGSISLNMKSGKINYNVEEICSINFTHQENNTYYFLNEEDLEDWDEGICDSNGCFLACREESDGGFMAIIADGKNLESTITLKFDSEFNIESIFSNRGFMSVVADDETNKKYYVIICDGNLIVNEVDDENNSALKAKIASPRSAVNALNNIAGWVNDALTAQDFENLLRNGSDYLPVFLGGGLLTSPLWGYGNLGNLGLSLFLNWAENKYENDYYRLLLDYMGAGNIYISDIDEENMPQYNVEATVYNGLNTIGKPLGCSIHAGIAVKLNDSHVFYDDCDMLLGNREVNSDTKFTTSLDAVKGTNYYLRPYLIVMIDGMLSQTPLTRPPYLWGGKPQPLIKYGDVRTICFNPNITPNTGDFYDITENSATVESSFGKLPKGAVCGVQYSSDGENFLFQSCTNEENVQSITLTGLEPMTTYTYCACVEYAGESYFGDTKTFTTLPPDISGTWNCTQKTWNSLTQSYKTETYTITLHKDGSVTHTSSMSSAEPVSGGWSYGQDGTLYIQIMDVATMTYNHGYDWMFHTETPKDPHEFNGYVYGWNFNSVSGYHQGNSNECTLTR